MFNNEIITSLCQGIYNNIMSYDIEEIKLIYFSGTEFWLNILHDMKENEQKYVK